MNKIFTLSLFFVVFFLNFNAYSQCTNGSNNFTWDGTGSGNEAVMLRTQTNISSVVSGCSGGNITVEVQLVDTDNVFYSNNIDGSDFSGTNGTFGQPGYTVWLDGNNDLFSGDLIPLGSRLSFVYTFSQPIILTDFVIRDIDYQNNGNAGRWKDQVEMTAVNGSTNVPLTATKVNASSAMSIVGQVATASTTDGAMDVTNTLGHATWSSTNSLTQLTVTYITGINNTSQQAMQMGNIAFCCPVDPCDAVASGNLDSDNDGISDICDLDDDNDGILDTDECNNTTSQPATFVITNNNGNGNESGTLNLPSGGTGTWGITHIFSNGASLLNHGLTTNNELYFFYDGNNPWDLTAANFSISTSANTDIQLVLYGYIGVGAQIPEPPGPDFGSRFSNYTISWTGGVGDAVINDPGNQTNQSNGATIANGGSFTQNTTIDNNLLQWNVVFPLGATNVTISATGGAAKEGFRFSALEVVCQDTDNDGVPNKFDTDSDNDGCPDAIEGSGGTKEYVLSDLLANSSVNIATYPVGTDGVPGTSAATSAPQGVGSSADSNTVVCCDATVSGFPDKDGDNIADTCDLDDDNDGILDTIECPATNASLTGTAGASSILSGYPASNLNDDNINTFVHTSIAASASATGFIEIDLGQARIINQIEIINRVSPAGDRNRLANVYVLIADTPFPTDPDNLMTSLSNADFTFQLASDETGDPVIPVPSVVGRYVRMQLSGNNVNTTGTPGQGILNIAELRAFNLQDTDGDLIPNCLDTDSDNDGCPDASEGANKITTGLVDLVGGSPAPGSIKNLGTTVTTTTGPSLGVPTATGSPQGTTSGVTTAVQVTAPTITSPQSVNTGDNITLDASAAAAASATSYSTGTPVYGTLGNANAGLRYEWQFNSGSGYTTVQAASTTATYTVTAATAANTGMYKVIITHIDNNCISEEVIVDLTVGDPCADGASTNGMPTASDTDGDGINNVCDVDDDNDGILDSVELRCDQPAEANSTSGTGSLQDQLYFFNWDEAAFANGLQVGDTQTFNLPSGLQIVATVKSVSGSGSATYVPTDMQTWPDGDFAKAYNTAGTKEAFYGSSGTAIDVTMTFVGTKNGMPYPLDLLAFDPESTGNNEQIIFRTNGGDWEFVETIHTQTSTGANGTYVVSGQTLTANETYQTGSSLYVSNRATELRIQSDGLSGTQAIAYGVFLRCDTDNDGIPNSTDTDSDNDGCPDAVEAAGSFLPTQLTALTGGSNGAGSSLLNFGTTVNTTQGNANYGLPIQDANGLAIAANMPQATAAAVLDNTVNTCQADLSLTKTVDKAIVKIGDTIIYTLTLKNDGSGDATGVQVTDALPTGITYVSDNSATTSTTYTGNVWNVGNLNVNQTISLQITATVSGAGTIVNTTQVTQSNQTDSDSTPNNGN